MANTKLLSHLNRALGIEYAAVIQYNQHSALIQGDDRKVYEDFFNDSSQEAHSHAKKVSDWIVSLGGTPTVETAEVKQATDLGTMLKQDLQTEQEALQAYRDAHAATGDTDPIRFMLEEQIILEQDDVWEIEKFLSMHAVKLAKGGSGQKAG